MEVDDLPERSAWTAVAHIGGPRVRRWRTFRLAPQKAVALAYSVNDAGEYRLDTSAGRPT